MMMTTFGFNGKETVQLMAIAQGFDARLLSPFIFFFFLCNINRIIMGGSVSRSTI